MYIYIHIHVYIYIRSGGSDGSLSLCSGDNPSGFYNINSITDTIVTQDNSTMKLLSVTLISQGHDSERFTSSIETTSAGDPLNFISGKNAHYLITVVDQVSLYTFEYYVNGSIHLCTFIDISIYV
jgi:hypothetical protein